MNFKILSLYISLGLYVHTPCMLCRIIISLVPRPTKFQCMVARRTQKLDRGLGVRLMGYGLSASCVRFVWAWVPIHDHMVPLFA